MNEPDIAPLARRLAEENNVDWRRLPGSGDGGRVVERDVLTFLARVMAGEEDLDPTPEPVPDGMAAWPADDVAAYRAGPAGGATERSTTATLDDDDLFLFDDDPVGSDASAPMASAGTGYGAPSADRASTAGSSEHRFDEVDGDDDGVLLVDEESAEVEPPEDASTGVGAFSFDDEPPVTRPRATDSDGPSLPDVFADEGASPAGRDDEVLFLDEPADVDGAAPTGAVPTGAMPADSVPAASAREPWAAWDGETEMTFEEEATADEPLTIDDVDEPSAGAAAGLVDDVWRRRDGPSVPAEPSEASAPVPDLPRPTGNGDARPDGVEPVERSSVATPDLPVHEDTSGPASASNPEASSAAALSSGGVALVRHGQLWRRRFDDRAFRATVSQVADALEASPVSVAEVLLARAAAGAWKVDDVDAWRWLPGGARRQAVESHGSLREAVAAVETATQASSDRRVSLAVTDLGTIDLDEAVVHLDVPLLAIGRATSDGAWLTLSGDEVPAEAVAALATVAESLKAPVRLLL